MRVTDDGVPVDQLIDVIKNTIKLTGMSNTDTDRDLRVTSVQVKLHTVAVRTVGGKLDFRVPFLGLKLKVGGSVTETDTHTMEITLIPEDLREVHEIRDGEVETVLAEAVETLRAVLTRAGQGDDPFVLKESFVELSFAVTEDGTISLGIDGELKDQITHTLKLGLGAYRD